MRVIFLRDNEEKTRLALVVGAVTFVTVIAEPFFAAVCHLGGSKAFEGSFGWGWEERRR